MLLRRTQTRSHQGVRKAIVGICRRNPAVSQNETGLHRHRQPAESSGADPGRYDRARPSYPAALVERIVAASPSPGVLDVGCGIAARQFQAAGCRVLGVDPDPRMAGLARQSGLEVERGGVLTDLAVLPGRWAGHSTAEQEGGEGGPPPHPPANPRIRQQRRVPSAPGLWQQPPVQRAVGVSCYPGVS
jgi:hypothetical protein